VPLFVCLLVSTILSKCCKWQPSCYLAAVAFLKDSNAGNIPAFVHAEQEDGFERKIHNGFERKIHNP
jgi:hypothetical protein